MKNTIILFLLAFCTLQLFAQDELNCKSLHQGFFTYTSEGETLYIYRDKNTQHEWKSDNTYYMTGTVEWESNCTYSMMLTEIVAIDYPEEYKAIATREQLDSFTNEMFDVLKTTKLSSEIMNVEGNSFSVYLDFLDEKETVIMNRLPKKEGKKKFKQIQKALSKYKKENKL